MNNDINELIKKAEKQEQNKKVEKAFDLALILGMQSKNPNIASFCKSFLKGKVIGIMLTVLMIGAFCIGAVYHIPWVFTLSVFGCCIWFYNYCDKPTKALAYVLDSMLILFWAFMRFIVMPFSW